MLNKSYLHTNRIKEGNSLKEKSFMAFVYIFVILFTIACIIPFWMVFINSFASESSIMKSGYQIIPSQFSLAAYKYLLSGKQIFTSYGVTLFVTVIGTSLALLITTMYAYVLAHPKVKYRKILSFLTYFTMLLGAGLVGFYILIANWLGLKDNIWALILPYLMNPFYAFILVAFFRTLPQELSEAATIDGANDIYIFFKIIIPIAKPAIATVALFYALGYWNDWWLSLLFIDNYKLNPLQMMLRQLMSNSNAASYVSGSGTNYNIQIPSYGIQLATVCLTIGPIILVYPFVQRFFVKGLTIGSVKG